MASRLDREPHWLDEYASKSYQWQTLQQCGRTVYYRPLGLVEFTFDADGRYLEGCADMNTQLDVEIQSTLSNEDLRERILFAWTCLRCKHLLLQAKALPTERLYGRKLVAGSNIAFAIEAPNSVIQAVEDAGRFLTFLGDHYDYVDPDDFWTHVQNVARVIEPESALAQLFVYPLEPLKDGRGTLRFLKVTSHQIEDGLTTYTWLRDFVGFLNMPIPEQRQRLSELLEPNGLYQRLPLPQEALYPPITGSCARQRWFWLLTRILRHVRRPLQAGFKNPVRRKNRRAESLALSPTYAPLLDYTKVPPLNASHLFVKSSAKHTQRLHRLCRESKASIGAGCFALAALIMMEMYEEQEPNIPLAERKPFISGFPLNPRAFFNHKVDPDSLMLAFCDGISLPFLSSDLDLEGRLRLLIRQAHRQLAAFQKRSNPQPNDGGLQYMGSRGAGRILSTQYILGIERLELRAPKEFRRNLNPQGGYPMRPNMSLQTCGVSSVGNRSSFITKGTYDLDDETKDFVADHRVIYACVRPRDEEFLVGVGGSDQGLWVNASIDANFIDPVLVDQWRKRFETVLDDNQGVGMSKL